VSKGTSKDDILQSIVDIDFSKAVKSADELGQKISEIDDKMRKASSSTKELSSLAIRKKLNESVSSISKMLDGSGGSAVVEETARFKKKVEDAVRLYITNKISDVRIDQKSLDSLDINVELGKTRIEKMGRQVSSSITGAINDAIDSGDLKSELSGMKVRISGKTIKSMNSRLNAQLVEALTGDNALLFDFGEGGKSNSFQLVIDEAKMKSISTALSDKITNYYSSPESIQVKGFQPIVLDNENLKEALSKVGDSIDHLMSSFNFDDDAVSAVNEVAGKVSRFSQVIQKFTADTVKTIESYVELAQVISNSSMEDISSETIQRSMQSISDELGKSIEVMMDKSVQNVKSATVDADVFTEFKKEAAIIQKKFRRIFVEDLVNIDKAVDAVSAGQTKYAKEVRMQMEHLMGKFGRNLVASIKGSDAALPEINFSDTIKSAFTNTFNSSLVQSMGFSVEGSLQDIEETLIDVMEEFGDQLATDIVQIVKENAELSIDPSTVSAIEVKVPMNALHEKTQDFLTGQMMSIMSGISLVSSTSQEVKDSLINTLDKRTNIKGIIGDIEAEGGSISEVINVLKDKQSRARTLGPVYGNAADQASKIINDASDTSKISGRLTDIISRFIVTETDNITTRYIAELSAILKRSSKGVEGIEGGKQIVESLSTKISQTLGDLLSNSTEEIFNDAVSELSLTSLREGSSSGIVDRIRDKVSDGFTRAIKDLISSSVVTLEAREFDGKPLIHEVNVDEIVRRFSVQLDNYLVNLVKKSLVILSDGGGTLDATNFSHLKDEVANTLEEFLNGEINGLISQVITKLSAQFDPSDYSEVTAIFNSLSSSLSEKIVSEISDYVNAASLQIASIDFSSLEGDTSERVRRVLRTAMSHMIEMYSNSLVFAVQTMYNAEDLRSSLTDIIKTDLSTAINNASISDDPLELDSIMELLTSKMENILLKSIMEFEFSEGALGKESFNSVIKPAFTSLLNGYAEQVSKDISSFTSDTSDEDITKFVGRMNDMTQKFLNTYTNAMQAKVGDVKDIKSHISFTTSRLSSAVKKNIASSLDMSVEELIKQKPKIEKDEMNLLFKGLIDTMLKQVSKTLESNLMSSVRLLKNDIKDIKIEPDASVINVVLNNLESFQDVLVKKMKELVKEQFSAVNAQIRGIGMAPINPMQLFMRNNSPTASVSAGGSGVNHTEKMVNGIDALNPNILNLEKAIREANSYAKKRVSSYSESFREYNPASQNRMMMSIINTFRYLIAGRLIGQPLLSSFNESWSSFKDVDYEMTKARQNMLAKFRGPAFDGMEPFQKYAENEAEHRLSNPNDYGLEEIAESIKLDESKKKELIEQIRKDMVDIMERGVRKPLQNMAVYLGISQRDIASAWQISSRSQDDPISAFAMTSAASRIYATEREEIKVEDAVKGVQAMVSQWGISPSNMGDDGVRDVDKLVNMVIKTGLQSQATAKDLLDGMSKSGAAFRTAFGDDMGTFDKVANSLAFLNLFIEATGRTGGEAGTFFRNILTQPMRPEKAEYLHMVSQTDNPVISKIDPYERSIVDGVEMTKLKGFHETFPSVVNAAIEMRRIGDQSGANELLSTLFRTRTFGYQQGIQYTMEAKFDELLDSLEENVGSGGTYEDYVANISGVLQSEIDTFIGGLSSSTQFKTDRVKSMFEATFFNIFEELKPEYAKLMDSTVGLLEGIRENAVGFSKLLEVTSKMLLTFGAYKMLGLGKEKLVDFGKSSAYEAAIAPVMHERAGLIRGRYEVQRGIHEIAKDMEIPEDEIENILKKRELADKYYKQYQEQGYEELYQNTEKYLPIYDKTKETLKDAEDIRYSGKPARQQMIDKGLIDMGEIAYGPTGEQEALDRLFDIIGDSKRKVEEMDESSHFLANREGYEDFKEERHIAERLYKEPLNEVNQFFKQNAELELEISNRLNTLKGIDESIQDSNRFIETTGKALSNVGLSEDSLQRVTGQMYSKSKDWAISNDFSFLGSQYFTDSLKVLDDEFTQGYISAEQYLGKLKELNSEFNEGSMMQPSIGEAIPGEGATAASVFLTKSFKFMGALSKAYIAMQALDLGTNVISSHLSHDSDNLQNRTLELSNFIGLQQDYARRDADKNYLEKALSPVSIMRDAIGTVNDLVDGTLYLLTSGKSGRGLFEESGKIREALRNSDGDMSIQELYELVDYSEKRAEADRLAGERQRMLEETSIYNRYRSIQDSDSQEAVDIRRELYQGTYENLEEFLARMKREEEFSRSGADQNYTLGRISYLNSGLPEGSREINDLMIHNNQVTIDLLEAHAEDLEKTFNDMREYDPYFINTEMGMKLQQELYTKQIEVANAREDQFDLELQYINEIERKFGVMSSALSLRFAEDELRLMRMGLPEDASSFINLKRVKLEDQINQLSKSITERESYLQEVQDKLSEDPNSIEKQNEYDSVRSTLDTEKVELVNLQKELLNFSSVQASAISGFYGRQKSLLGAESSISKSMLELRGYDNESFSARMVERASLVNQNEVISSEIGELRKVLQNEDLESKRQEILIQIRNLEAESLQNLVGIYNLQKQSSWGLPAGISPMTNYDYEARRSDQRSMSISSGGVNVVVKFDRVYANSKEDINRNIVDPTVRAISKYVTEDLRGQMRSF